MLLMIWLIGFLYTVGPIIFEWSESRDTPRTTKLTIFAIFFWPVVLGYINAGERP